MIAVVCRPPEAEQSGPGGYAGIFLKRKSCCGQVRREDGAVPARALIQPVLLPSVSLQVFDLF
ncbi:hypothetical protein ASZ90_010112 [hydrocarbon metagenome]|uniref:Uncharacterized protein n=1 Tax=hydrocarbon metagenome TaxID=938273 RepID=A0A0W8FHD3_9ZZZZ